MKLSRRDFVLGGIGALFLGRRIKAEENLFLPSLEEIATLMSEEPNEILKTAIERRDIKKFEYTKNTKPEDFYKFLGKEFQNKIVFVYLCTNEESDFYEHGDTKRSTYDKLYGRGPAITFLYTKLNLEKLKSDIGFLFLEITNTRGMDNWGRLFNLFNVRRMGIPSTAEFKKTSEGYELVGIADTGFKEPDKILKHVKLWVDYSTKK